MIIIFGKIIIIIIQICMCMSVCIYLLMWCEKMIECENEWTVFVGLQLWVVL